MNPGTVDLRGPNTASGGACRDRFDERAMRAGGGAVAGNGEMEALVVDIGLAARYKDVSAALCTQGVVLPAWIELACVRLGRERQDDTARERLW